LHRFLRFFLLGPAWLPLAALHALGSVLGWAMYGMSPTYRRRLREHLEQAGYRDAGTRREAIASAGRMILETPAVWFRSRARLAALIRSAEGAEAALAACKGKGALFLTPHLGCFEIAGQWVAMQLPVTILYRRPKMAWLDPLMREGRGQANVRLAPADRSGVREVLAALKRGEAAGFLPDQVPGEGEGEWAEMFGRARRRGVHSHLRQAPALGGGLCHGLSRAAAGARGRAPGAAHQPRAREPDPRMPGAVPVEL
jgi:Kdo2-lipid IVA lauroyltransferase/acyltransferase